MLVHESKSNDNCMRHNAVMELIFPIMRMCGQREICRLGAHTNDPKREEFLPECPKWEQELVETTIFLWVSETEECQIHLLQRS